VDGNFKPHKEGDPAPLGLNKNDLTLAERLKEHGYQNGISGKWHLDEEKGYLPVGSTLTPNATPAATAAEKQIPISKLPTRRPPV
jgi:arylsulfatase A-like enzyme